MTPDRDPTLSYAPWTLEEVRSLQEFQVSGRFHEFTCGAGHGALLATSAGWICWRADCVYRQSWAHRWMTDGRWRDASVAAYRDDDDPLTRRHDAYATAYAELHELVRRFLAGTANRQTLRRRHREVELDLQRVVANPEALPTLHDAALLRESMGQLLRGEVTDL